MKSVRQMLSHFSFSPMLLFVLFSFLLLFVDKRGHLSLAASLSLMCCQHLRKAVCFDKIHCRYSQPNLLTCR